ncbi:uncharacterized protein LOC143211556 [Lasioglossum baleicum]|uniref:uncharacterized protein LOC143211556 n=1 Tax=Lasioglossum baleicum TaxID=434251 RepID=UPI003FCC908F
MYTRGKPVHHIRGTFLPWLDWLARSLVRFARLSPSLLSSICSSQTEHYTSSSQHRCLPNRCDPISHDANAARFFDSARTTLSQGLEIRGLTPRREARCSLDTPGSGISRFSDTRVKDRGQSDQFLPEDKCVRRMKIDRRMQLWIIEPTALDEIKGYLRKFGVCRDIKDFRRRGLFNQRDCQ